MIIGDTGFGLANPANMDEFCQEFSELTDKWEDLKPEERRGKLEDVINRQLDKSGVPGQKVSGSPGHPPGNAQYNFGRARLEISQNSLDTAKMDVSGARKLANSLYHEARHAEQWYLMARHVAGQGQTAEQIRNSMQIHEKMAKKAFANPLSGMSPQGNLGQASYDSVYGTGGQNRNAVLRDIQNRYDEYRALPEEQDAWKTGNATPCGKPSS